jgi:CRISPR-associated protein Csx10
MRKIKIELSLQSPVCITKHRGVANVIQTQSFIPGSVLRGAMAAEYIKMGYETEIEFRSLFNEKKAWFGDLYKNDSKPVPFSAITCKYYPGLKNHDQIQPQHGVVDTVIPRIRYEHLGQELSDSVKCCQNENCKDKEIPMMSFGGFYQTKELFQLKSIQIDKSIQAHTQIFKELLTAKEQNLFSIEQINPGQTFSGVITLEDTTDSSLLEDFIANSATLVLGRDKTRGMGKVNIYQTDEIEPPAITYIQNKINQFNKKLFATSTSSRWFVLTLSSRTILLNTYLMYKPVIDTKDLTASVPEGEEFWNSCRLVRAWNRMEPIEGWNSMVGFPKAQEAGISAGSVFVFQTDRALGNDEFKYLQLLSSNGVGLRREEGFGACTICDEFHWIRDIL